MADISTGQAQVSTTPTVIIPYDLAGKAVIIRNTGTSTVYIGGSGVTPATGYPLLTTDTPMQPLPVNEPIYGVTSSGTSSIAFIEANS